MVKSMELRNRQTLADFPFSPVTVTLAKSLKCGPVFTYKTRACTYAHTFSDDY